ncbi:YheC/YheD family protein [Phosphitispora sp. TUW77]|uniref:YheC/YheD family endospore coat-associated protein n=1 Tax=Phosphitispora sp. TUW77 TaxID=3152361 RepID=UPI003AB77672
MNLTCSPFLPDGSLTVSEDLFRHIRCNLNEEIRLLAGNNILVVKFRGSHRDNMPSVQIDSNTCRGILLPVPLKLELILDSSTSTWRLGPVIGILAHRFDKTLKPFGEQTSFFRKLINCANSINAVCFAFSPGDINWKNETIQGLIPEYSEKSTLLWKQAIFPFPDVIYDRGLFPKGEKRSLAAEVRRYFRKHSRIKLFNPAFFGKWKTHHFLSEHEGICRHLPETLLYTEAADVAKLIARHGTVYLKPSGGSSGKGIIVLFSRTSGYIAAYREFRNLKTVEITGFSQLNTVLDNLIKGRRYVVQQGINLAKIDGNPFDIRVLMQKNRNGEWLRTGIAARVAAAGNLISNIHAGGHAEKITKVLQAVFPNPKQAQKILNDIRNLSALIVAFISKEGNPLFGEIAVDLGVDESGKVWIIECNAIPGRSVFRRIGAKDIVARALSRPMEYAYYLSGFASKSEKYQEEEHTRCRS